MPESILQDLSAIFGKGSVLTGNQASHYGEDESHAESPNVLAVVFPKAHDQLVQLVLLARKVSITLVASGGRTGLSGAAVARQGEVVVSFEKMNQLVEVDSLSRQITVQAGMTIEQLQNIATENGLFYPVDYASKGTAQVGGALATNAGGIRVLKYGMTRDWVAGLKAVTGIGETVSIDRCLVKDNAAYDLKNLIIGSEGTLALISEVTFDLTMPMQDQQTVLLAFDGLQSLIDLFQNLREKYSLNAAEFFCQNSLNQVCSVFNKEPPFSENHQFYLLIEFDRSAIEIEVLAEIVGETPVILSQSIEQTKNLWCYRELISSSLNPRAPYKNDIACKLSLFSDWFSALQLAFDAFDDELSIAWFGHLGDGNIHINVLKPASMTEDLFESLYNNFDQSVAEICQKYNASISAEHGIGLLKKSLLPYGRSESEIALCKAIKTTFDPDCLLNPGKIFD